MKLLQDKVAIVTGAGSGIGKAISLLLSENGARVLLTDINDEHGKAVVAEIQKKGGEATYLKADSSNAEDSKATVDKALNLYGKLDIAINNAGIGGASTPTADYPIEAWNQVININLNGVFYGMKYQISAMQKTSKNASIVNLSSILGKVGFPNASAYAAAKHGVIGLTETAALEYAKEGIRINSVGPGYIVTPLIEKIDHNHLIALHPMGRLGEVNEIAELLLWLASDKASFVTGAYYPIDGGYLAR